MTIEKQLVVSPINLVLRDPNDPDAPAFNYTMYIGIVLVTKHVDINVF